MDIISHGENIRITGLAKGDRKGPGIVLPCRSSRIIDSSTDMIYVTVSGKIPEKFSVPEKIPLKKSA
ncbi:MAG: hypothetical protein LUO98_04395 [Methanoregula sp.]|nr:hypothetical protein [Methanoregula sp.]